MERKRIKIESKEVDKVIGYIYWIKKDEKEWKGRDG